MNYKSIVKSKALKFLILSIVIVGISFLIISAGQKTQNYNVFSIITGINETSSFEKNLVNQIANKDYVMFSGKIESEVSGETNGSSTSQYIVTVGPIMKNDGSLEYREKITVKDSSGKIADGYSRDLVAVYDKNQDLYDATPFKTYVHEFNAKVVKKLGTERIYGEKAFKYEVSVTYSPSISRNLSGKIIVYSFDPNLVLVENSETSFNTVSLVDGKHIVLSAGGLVVYD